jgi:very-short-patch-repair endonuclease
LPEDDRGIDLQQILRRYREAVKRIEGWEIRDTARLGLFSFSRFLMWRDLAARADDLRRSELVRRLIRDDSAADEPEPTADPLTEPAEAMPEDPLLTRDADASQVAAVRAAAAGETFVLQGPPGTGKSQTIANLIADTLGRGERVLFVAEKRAALSVVRRRLESDGLGPFCLELHSNRASKREVLEQLKEPLELASAAPPAERDATVRKLTEARDRVDGVVRELNAPRASGESVREVIARLTELGEEPVVGLAIGEPAEISAEALAAVRAHVAALADAARVVAESAGSVANHPLRGIGVQQFSFALPDQARTVLDELSARADELSEAADSWLRAIGCEPAAAPSARELEWRVNAGELLARCPGTTAALLGSPEWTDLRDDLARWLDRGRKRDAERSALLERYDRAILSLDLPTLAAEARRASARSGVFGWWAMRPIRAALKAVALRETPDADTALADVDSARAVVDETEALRTATEPSQCFGRRWAEGEADWDALSAMLDWADAARVLLADAGPGHIRAGVPERFRAIAVGESPAPDDETQALRTAHKSFVAVRDEVERLLIVEWQSSWGDRSDADHLGRVRATTERWRGSIPDLSDWCVWQREREAATRAGLGALIDPLESDDLAIDELSAAFERSFGQQWLRVIADRSDAIRAFSARAHTQAIRRFAELDEHLLELNRQLVRATLAAAVPPPAASPSPQSEVGILRRQFELKRRHLPIRQLVERIPGTLARLKPCFLMSPLSIAQYLDPALPPFDLVVFDEASQIPPWEAIGAIARGSRVVVVGDSKQLPPTSFFEKAEPEDDETATEAEELESILQECVASGVQTRRLLWHYRSRHDSLIAFSNEHYYDNTLRTFPAPAEPGDELGVTFRKVGGVYDRGTTRTNRGEAEAIVDELARLLKGGGVTIGVVCFNLAQQVLIEDLFDERCRADAELEAARTASEADHEPAFIKNLESVQGDERDVILFSVTYGPDERGSMTMHFGPLNRDGGERRLNVAVTRARRRVVAFASFEPEAIDPGRTQAVGVLHLRRFLEMARSGNRHPATEATHATTDGPIERAVRDELIARGHDVAERVGSGSSRVDLAVRDPHDPSRFVLGIEFDGPAYAEAGVARDRDRLRPSVMAGLGWRMHRVWSVDWRLNREGVLRSLDRAIAEAKRAAKAPPAEHPIAGTHDDPADAAGHIVEDEPTGITSATAPPIEAHPVPPAAPPAYSPWFPETLIGDRDTLMDERRPKVARDTLAFIVAAEAPITRALATRRLAEAFGVERLIKSVRERCETVIEDLLGMSKIAEQGDALWAGDIEPEPLEPRTPGDTDASKRSLDDIPLAERTAAVRWVLREQVSLPDDELAKHAARLLGTQRLSDKTEPLMRAAIDRYRADASD